MSDSRLFNRGIFKFDVNFSLNGIPCRLDNELVEARVVNAAKAHFQNLEFSPLLYTDEAAHFYAIVTIDATQILFDFMRDAPDFDMKRFLKRYLVWLEEI